MHIQLRDIFKQAAASAPSLIFIDEIDALAPQREQSTQETEKRVVGTLLSLMDGIDSQNTASGQLSLNSRRKLFIVELNRSSGGRGRD